MGRFVKAFGAALLVSCAFPAMAASVGELPNGSLLGRGLGDGYGTPKRIVLPLSINQGGTGAIDAATARANLGVPAPLTLPLGLSDGGTGGTDAATARSNLGLSLPLALSSGGTAATSAPQGRVNLGAMGHLPTNAALVAASTADYPDGVIRDIYAAGNLTDPVYFHPLVGTCAANSMHNDGAVCVDAAGGNSFRGHLAVPINARLFGVTYPLTLYIAPGGSDANSNECLDIALPCLTLQRAADVIAQFDQKGLDATINMAAGTYTGGVIIGGVSLGSSGPKQLGGGIIIKGAGSGSTNLAVSTNCGTAPSGIFAGRGAYIRVGSLTISTSCTSGNDLVGYYGGHIELDDADVILGASTNAKILMFGGSSFNSGYAFKMTGNSVYAFSASTHSSIFFGSAITTITLTGTPAFSVFANAIDNSIIDTGGSIFSGSATGTRYSLFNGGFIDTEQVTTPLPGDGTGLVGPGSNYYKGVGACIGSNAGCNILAAPTGLGGSGTAAIVAGSAGDSSGVLTLQPSAGASTAGTVYVGTPSILVNSQEQTGACVVGLNNAGASWNPGAHVEAYYTGGNNPYLTVSWDNLGLALTNGGTYPITYVCR